MFDNLRRGDRISWWDDGHGRGAQPDTPGAIRREGVVESLHRHPDTGAVVAVSVQCHSTLSGAYGATVRPDYGHEVALEPS